VSSPKGRRQRLSLRQRLDNTFRLVAKNGAKVILGVRRVDRLEAIAKDIHSEGGIAEYQALDLTQCSQLEAIVQIAQIPPGSLLC
jgi:NADP-dependent 3-hydroxy acid dehydrogenase YdfG